MPITCAAQKPAQKPAEPLTAVSLAHKVDDHYNHLRSLTAHFVEHFHGMGMDRTESGTLTLQKPGRMRWAYDSPAGKLFVLDGHDAISYTPGDPQASRLPARQLDDLRSPLRFLLGHTELGRELEGLNLSSTPEGYVLAGVPRGLSARVRAILLTVDLSGVIHAMRLEETDGSVTSFTLTGQHENVPTRATDFRFTPPPGVPIVNGTAPM